MKETKKDQTKSERQAFEDQLFAAILKLKKPDECRRFFADLCTPTELEAFADRWQVAKLLTADMPYRQITKKCRVSLATVSRVARFLHQGNDGYQLVLKRLAKV